MSNQDRYAIRKTLQVGSQSYQYYSLPDLERGAFAGISKLPISIRVLLEAAVRQ